MATLTFLIALLVLSFNTVWLQYALWSGANPLALNLWQALFASAAFTLFAFFKDRTLFRVGKAGACRLMCLGGFGFFLMAILFIMSLRHLSAALSVAVYYFYPFFVLTGSALFYKVKLKILDCLTLLTLAGGILVLTNPGGGVSTRGLLLSLGSSLAQAFFILFGADNLQRHAPLQVNLFIQYGYLAAALLSLPFFWPLPLFHPASVSYGLLMCTLSSCAGYLLLLKGIAGLGANKSAVISVLNLPLNLLYAFLFLGNRLSGSLLAGSLLVFAGIALESRCSARRKEAGVNRDLQEPA